MSYHILFCDLGDGAASHGVRLVEDDNKVYYYSPNMQVPYPIVAESITADGFGMVRVSTIESIADKVDLIICADISFSGVGDFFHKLGIPVICGVSAIENLERNRLYAKYIFKQLNIPYPITWVKVGVEKALHFLQDNPGMDFYMKLNYYRGNMESCRVQGYDQAKPILDKLRGDLGPYSETMPIIFEKTSGDIQMGVDAFFCGNHFLPIKMNGCEIGGDLIGKIEDNNLFDETLKRLTPFLAYHGYRGPMSLEGMYDEKTGQVLICDVTSRFPYPLSCLFAEFCPENYGQFLMDIATADDAEYPLGDDKYYAIGSVYAKQFVASWMMLDFPENIHIRHRNVVKGKDGKIYYVKGKNALVCSVMGSGNTEKSVLDKVAKDINEVEMPSSKNEFSQFLGDYNERKKKIKKLGLDF